METSQEAANRANIQNARLTWWLVVIGVATQEQQNDY